MHCWKLCWREGPGIRRVKRSQVSLRGHVLKDRLSASGQNAATFRPIEAYGARFNRFY